MKRILWSLLLLGALVAGGCGYKTSVSEEVGDGTVATNTKSGFINYTVPNNGDTGIISNSTIYVLLNQGMDEKTIIPSYFPVKCGTTDETVAVVYESASKTVKITPTDGSWTEAAECKVTVKGTSLRDSSGKLLGTDSVFTFTTASGGGSSVPITTPLAVDFTVPIDNATGVTVSETFNMIFNKTLNPMTVVGSSFAAACGSTTSQTPVTGFAVAYNSANKAVVITPPADGWPGSQVCKITARGNYVMDSANVPLASDLTFTFSTGAGGVVVGATPLAVDYAIPVPPADQIDVNTALTFVFNKTLNPDTVVSSAFTAFCGGNKVNGYSVTNNTANNSVKISPPSTGWGSGLACDITIKQSSLWAADDQNMLNDYAYSFSTITKSGVAVDRLAMRASKYSVKSTGTDSATLTVSALDANGATIPDIAISLSTDRGQLSKSTITTGTDGTASFTFTADTTRANGVATITASSAGKTVSLPMTITGTTLVMTADKTTTKTGLADDITLSGTLKDADSVAIALSEVTITSALGSTLKDKSTGVTGSSSIKVKTDGAGNFALGYTATAVGSDNVTAIGFGASGTALLTVTDATFAFTTPVQNTVVNCNDPKELKVYWTDETGNPKGGQPVTFSATNGSFGGSKTKTVTTGSDGYATVTFTASAIASPDTITATAGALQTILTLDIRANNPTQLNVQATSTVIGIKSEGETPTTTIIATVRDPQDNPVAGQVVSFSLDTGAGGGEYLNPPIAVTDSAGQAKTTFFSGTAASLQNGVTVRASIDSPALTDTVNLTISGAAASIVFGTTNKIGAITVDGYPIAYELPISVLVTDINGGPVANKAISIGIYPTQFYTGESFLDTVRNVTVWIVSGIFGNEDKNRNAILDPGEDGGVGTCFDESIGGRDCSGFVYYHSGSEGQVALMSTSQVDATQPNNGRLDPRNVATVPMEVITDDNGLAVVKIVYPKSYCNWVTAELTATTQVSGTETRAIYNTELTCMDNDKPYADSPFGF